MVVFVMRVSAMKVRAHKPALFSSESMLIECVGYFGFGQKREAATSQTDIIYVITKATLSGPAVMSRPSGYMGVNEEADRVAGRSRHNWIDRPEPSSDRERGMSALEPNSTRERDEGVPNQLLVITTSSLLCQIYRFPSEGPREIGEGSRDHSAQKGQLQIEIPNQKRG